MNDEYEKEAQSSSEKGKLYVGMIQPSHHPRSLQEPPRMLGSTTVGGWGGGKQLRGKLALLTPLFNYGEEVELFRCS